MRKHLARVVKGFPEDREIGYAPPNTVAISFFRRRGLTG